MSKSRSHNPYFEYAPLPQGWIRLLKIHNSTTDDVWRDPSEPQDDIRISLEDYELSSPPPYIALSYTWGEPTVIPNATLRIFTKETRCYPILCQGRLLRCTRNLRDALRRLRMKPLSSESNSALCSKLMLKPRANLRKAKVELYWIDALCINQESIRERSEQVALMGSIYKQATACLVWLGEKDKFTGTAMSTATQVWTEANSEAAAGHHLPLVQREELFQARMEKLWAIPQSNLDALLILFSRTWFSRLWVVQEAVLAPVLWVQCGPFFIDFRCLLYAGESLCLERSFRTRIIEQYTPLKEFGLDASAPDAFVYIKTLEFLTQLSRIRTDSQQGKKSDFVEIVQMVGMGRATEVRDRIYAILDITAEFDVKSGQAPLITLDYSLPVGRVFTEAVIAVSQRKNNLSFLRLVDSQTWKNVPNLPSWCPDFSCGRLGFLFPRGFEPLKQSSWFETLFDRTPRIEYRENLLLVDGVLYDTISRVSGKKPEYPSFQTISDLLRLVFQLETGRVESLGTLWKIIMLDEPKSQTHSQAVAALFFPALCIWCLYRPTASLHPREEVTTIEHLTEQIKAMMREIEILMTMIEHPGLFSTSTSLFLPEGTTLSMLRNVLQNLLLSSSTITIQDIDEVCNQALLSELRSIPIRAQRTGFSGQLKELMDLNSAVPQVRTEDVFKFFRKVLLHPAESQLPWLSIYSTKSQRLGAVRELVGPGDEIWALHGFESFVVMRPKGSDVYSFCGTTYIPGKLEAGNLDLVNPLKRESSVRRIAIE